MASKTNLNKQYHIINKPLNNAYVFSFDSMAEVEKFLADKKWKDYIITKKQKAPNSISNKIKGQ